MCVRQPQKQIFYVCLMIAAFLLTLIDKWGPYLSLIVGFVIVVCMKSLEMNSKQRRGFPVILNKDSARAQTPRLTASAPPPTSPQAQQNSD